MRDASFARKLDRKGVAHNSGSIRPHRAGIWTRIGAARRLSIWRSRIQRSRTDSPPDSSQSTLCEVERARARPACFTGSIVSLLLTSIHTTDARATRRAMIVLVARRSTDRQLHCNRSGTCLHCSWRRSPKDTLLAVARDLRGLPPARKPQVRRIFAAASKSCTPATSCLISSSARLLGRLLSRSFSFFWEC